MSLVGSFLVSAPVTFLHEQVKHGTTNTIQIQDRSNSLFEAQQKSLKKITSHHKA